MSTPAILASIPLVRIVATHVVAAPRVGRYYELPGGAAGLCYATGTVWAFAGADGEPDVNLSHSDGNAIREMEIEPCISSQREPNRTEM
jgi:hypothetical protein